MKKRSRLVASLVWCLGCEPGTTAPEPAPVAPQPEAEPAEVAESPEAEPASVRPGVNEGYSQKPVETFVERFEGEGREVFDHREAIVEAIGLQPGDAIVDIGAGTGLFMPLFSAAVGADGRVTAVDIVPNFLARLRERAKEHPNVTVVAGEDKRLLVDAGSQDKAVMIDVYHHIEYPELFMRSVYEGLRPGGELIVIDFRRIEGESEPWLLDHVRAGQEVVTAEITSVGFELVETRDELEENYFLRFRRE